MIEISGIQFEENGASINFMVVDKDMRDSGKIMQTRTLHISDTSALAEMLDDVEVALEELVQSALEIFSRDPAFVPEALEDDDDDEEYMGMQ